MTAPAQASWWAPLTLPGAPLHRRMLEAWTIGLLWVLLTLPPVVLSLSRPKEYVSLVEGGQEIPELAARLTTACNAAVILVCAVVVVLRVREVRPARLPLLGLLLLPWVLVVVRLVMLDRTPSMLVLVYPAVATAMWLLRPRAAVVELLGYLVGALAAVSIALGALLPSAGILVRAAGAELEKPVGPWGILAGPMLSGNDLAALLVLGLAATLTIRRPGWRVAAVGLTVVALVWTASRTSWLAAAVCVLAVVVVRAVRARWAGRGAASAAAAGLGLLALTALVLPLVTPDGTSFNNRAHYWSFALAELWERSPVLGLGADWFKQLATREVNLGGHASDAHNLTVQVLTGGGLLLLAAVVALLGYAVARAVRAAREGVDWPVAHLAAFFTLACLEVPLTFDDRVREMPYTVLPLLVILCSRSWPRGDDQDGSSDDDEIRATSSAV